MNEEESPNPLKDYMPQSTEGDDLQGFYEDLISHPKKVRTKSTEMNSIQKMMICNKFNVPEPKVTKFDKRSSLMFKKQQLWKLKIEEKNILTKIK